MFYAFYIFILGYLIQNIRNNIHFYTFLFNKQ